MQTNADKPRSVRLTKAHRLDITNAVMQQWEKRNPSPSPYAKMGLVEDLFTHRKTVPVKTPQEFRQVAKLWEAHAEWVEVSKHLSASTKDRLALNTETSFYISILNADGSEFTRLHSILPAQLAEKTGLPCIGVTSLGRYATKHHELPPEFMNRDNTTVANLLAKNCPVLAIKRSDPIFVKYEAAVEALSDWRKKLVQMRSEVSDYLEQFTTTNQIRELWPEIADYLPAHIADPVRAIQLPALPVSRLNERLGLK